MKERISHILHAKAFWFLVVLCMIFVLLRIFVIETIEVQGESMLPVLQNRDRILIEKLTYKKKECSRNDIVVVDTNGAGEKQQYVKRVIGLPGETIQILHGKVYINDEELKEKYKFESIEDGGMAREVIVLGEDEYFLLGDNRNNSKDSRNVELGVVKKQQIKGKVWIRVVPLDKIGKVED